MRMSVFVCAEFFVLIEDQHGEHPEPFRAQIGRRVAGISADAGAQGPFARHVWRRSRLLSAALLQAVHVKWHLAGSFLAPVAGPPQDT